MGGRALAARLEYPKEPLTRLCAAACEISLQPEGDAAAFDAALAAAKRRRVDPLWLALALHLARRSDDRDRRLLTERVASAHEDDSPLGWGLRYIVRGDVLLDGGRVITLDELSDLHGLPRLPLLKEMPYELEVRWEDDTAKARGGPPPRRRTPTA